MDFEYEINAKNKTVVSSYSKACYFDKNDVWGTAITIEKEKATVAFTNSANEIMQTHEIDLK